MPKKQRFIKHSSSFSRALVATALLSNGIFQFVAPVLAEGTAAGQSISNTATATYDNPDDPTTPLNATSNTVTVTVAEVAGVTVTDNAPTFKTDTNSDGDYNTNDIIYFNFSVKNTGNDPTKFVIPESPLVTDNNSTVNLGELESGAKVEISYDNGSNWASLPSGGVTDSVAADATILVRVPVKILNNGDPTNGDQISVQLGDTTNNAQNIARTTTDATDLYTQDNTGTQNGDASANPPVNDVREASDTSTLTLSLKALLNGPQGSPAANYNGDNNQDFTNKSSAIDPGTAPGSLIDPSAVTFTNTIQNTGTGTNNISLLPTPPTAPANIGDLPNNTVVKISANNGNTTATYTYNSTTGVFTFTSGTGTVGGNSVSATNPVRIDNVAAGDTAPYTVEVNLPANTPLSTDIEKGFPVPVTAFVDLNSNGILDANEPKNITIDRVYTGFLKLVKLSRVLDANGNNLTGDRAAQSDFETTPVVGTASTLIPRTPLPGEIIEYLIRYKNIAVENNTGGANNVLLNVSGLVITEDGTLSTAPGDGKNNWAKDNDSNGEIDTSHVMNSAVDSGTGATITYTPSEQSGTTQATDVTKYVNTITVPVAPGVQRTFTFRRKVN